MTILLVEKSDIQNAKSKIGDRNAELIASILHIEKYDERNRKGLCCFHHEDTPSLVYNPKSYSFHCFGCGKNVDLIDAYMHDGCTYINAVKKLFEESGTKYSFGEHGVKNRADYKYPKLPPENDMSAVKKYLALRGISDSTIDRSNIMQDERGNIAFCYYDTNDILKMVKYRPSRKVEHGENKNWCQQGADTEPLLFNMNRVNADEPLVITEGELDATAIIESGYSNVVSVPFGAQNYEWVEHNWDFLEQFDSVIICGDNDDPGQKMVREVTSRLGSWRVKVADLPTEFQKPDGSAVKVKDANEVLVRFGADTLRNAIANAKDTPVPSVVDFSDIEDVDLNEIDGIHVGIKSIDKAFLRLFFGTFNIVSGTPGSGKTSFLYQIICNAMDEGTNCWVYSRELSTWLSRNWQMYILAGNRNVEKKVDEESNATYYVVPKEKKKEISEYYRGKLCFYRDDYPNDSKSLLKAMTDSRRKYGSRVFLLDNLMTIDLGGSDENKNERQTAFINELIQFSTKYDCCVILVAHPRKMIDSSADIDIYDVSGSSNIINLAHRAIGLRRVNKSEKEGVPNKRGDGWDKKPNPYSVMISVFKDRLRGKAGMTVGAYYDIPSRRFFTCPEEYDKQYSWDKNKYTESIQYPVDEHDEEVFGKIDE